MLQSDVCCKAIHQNFNCGCVLKKGYANLQLSANQNKKLQYRKFEITGLKSSLGATEKYAYCLGYLHWLSKFKCYIPFLLNKVVNAKLQARIFEKHVLASRTESGLRM